MTLAGRNGTTQAAARLGPIFDALTGRVVRQEEKYGPFPNDVAGVRLALAVLQDEMDEALLAWRDERRADNWNQTIGEVRDVAGVALRLLVALEEARL